MREECEKCQLLGIIAYEGEEGTPVLACTNYLPFAAIPENMGPGWCVKERGRA